MRAIQLQEFGGPEIMQLVEIPTPEPAADQVLIKVTHAGINFADTHQRENSYLAKFELPLTPGAEVAGIVEGAAAGFERGQRVVALVGSGGYAEYVAAPVATTMPIPDGVEDSLALALLIQGLTAWHLFKTSAKLAEGESVVVIAAAGGVGSLAVQLAKPFGAGRVIATASSAEKRELALDLGADVALDPNAEELSAALIEANDGHRVDVVLEMAGGRVFDECLKSLAPFGRLVTYGIASRELNTVTTGALMQRSQAVVGFWLMHCLSKPDLIGPPLQDLYERAARGDLRVVVGNTYGLDGVQRAHEDLQGRRTQGKQLLDPSL